MDLLHLDKILWLIMASESDYVWSLWSLKLTREIWSNKYEIHSL